jgi:hypothetical protein
LNPIIVTLINSLFPDLFSFPLLSESGNFPKVGFFGEPNRTTGGIVWLMLKMATGLFLSQAAA